MQIYNKLIRDKIPEIIKREGRKFDIKVLNDEEYISCLNNKLQEELNEYFKDNNVEELADIVEVIYGILDAKGITKDEFEKIRLAKKEKRGGFKQKLYLISVED